jgi:pilus assembly protein Flp/PilA
MKRMLQYLRNEKGATAVEYGIMIGLIAAIIIGVVIVIGDQTNNAFEAVNANMNGVAPFNGS